MLGAFLVGCSIGSITTFCVMCIFFSIRDDD